MHARTEGCNGLLGGCWLSLIWMNRWSERLARCFDCFSGSFLLSWGVFGVGKRVFFDYIQNKSIKAQLLIHNNIHINIQIFMGESAYTKNFLGSIYNK